MPKKATATSDLARVTTWWKTLGDDRFVVLPPPTRNRYTQSEGHDDFVEWASRRGLPASTSYAFWHWQAHDAFDSAGMLTSPLYLYWGGDLAVVRDALGDGPEGFAITNGGPQSAFTLDRATTRDADGLPDPDDAAGVRQFLADINEPISRQTPDFRYHPLTQAQESWLHAWLAERPLAESGEAITALERRDALGADEAENLIVQWIHEDASDLTGFRGWRSLVRAGLRHDLDGMWDLVDVLGAPALTVASEIPSEPGLERARALSLAGDAEAVIPWVTLHHALRGGPWRDALHAVAIEADEAGARPEIWQQLGRALHRVTPEVWDGLAVDFAAGDGGVPPITRVHALQVVLDDRYPRGLRQRLLENLPSVLPALRAALATLPGEQPVARDFTAHQAVEAIDTFSEVEAELQRGSGPLLTGSESILAAEFDRYRSLSDDDIAWLRAQVADPATEMQGLGFCLELLYAHGVASEAEIEALLPRWRKELGKSYKTTYTEWRHPLVVLTCLALDLGHPVASSLQTWWTKPTPAWRGDLVHLTALGAPTEERVEALWQYMMAGNHDSGHLVTWILARARLDDVEPIEVADSLMVNRSHGLRDYVLHRALIAVADPQQPLWHFSVGHTRGWWDRIVEVADREDLSDESRAAALKAARGHRLASHPEHVRPRPPAEVVEKAREWLRTHPEAG